MAKRPRTAKERARRLAKLIGLSNAEALMLQTRVKSGTYRPLGEPIRFRRRARKLVERDDQYGSARRPHGPLLRFPPRRHSF